MVNKHVTGIGGLFFRAKNPKEMAEWYKQHLGIDPVPTGEGQEPWTQEAGTTVFSPFPEDTKYFGNDEKQWMINFRVRDLGTLVDELRASKIEVTFDPEMTPYGMRFARLSDPEGNPIESYGNRNERNFITDFVLSGKCRKQFLSV